MKKRLLALTLALTMVLGSTVVYAETEDEHDSVPFTKVTSSTESYNYVPQINFLKCIGNTSNSLTFALGTSYTKTYKKNNKIVQDLIKPDHIHYVCTDLKTDEEVEGEWSPSSLKSVTLALGTKTTYVNESKIEYKKVTYLANGITSAGKVSGGYTISGLTPGHKYSVKVTVWNNGSHNIQHVDENDKTYPCYYFDTLDTAVYKSLTTATVATAPKKGDLGVDVVSTRYNKIDATEQTIYVNWNKNAGVDKYGYLVSYMSGNDLKEYTGNYKSSGTNPDISGSASGAYIKVPSNKVSKIVVYSTGSVYGLHKITNTVGSQKQKASYYDWYLAPSTDKASAKAIEVIPQVQVKKAANTGNKIKLSWSKISGLSSSDKYVIYCSTANSTKSFKKIATVNSNTSSYTITKVGNSKIDSKKNYYLYVVAVDSSVDLPDNDVDIDVDQKQVKSLVNYIYRATKNGKPNLLGKR